MLKLIGHRCDRHVHSLVENETKMTSYFLRMIRLLHILQRLNGYSCTTYCYRKNLECKISWFDITAFILTLVFYISTLIYYLMVQFKFRNFNSSIYLMAIYALNVIAWSAVIVICSFNMKFRHYICGMINKIDGITREVTDSIRSFCEEIKCIHLIFQLCVPSNDDLLIWSGHILMLVPICVCLITAIIFYQYLDYFFVPETSLDYFHEYLYLVILICGFYAYILSWLEILVYLNMFARCFAGVNQHLMFVQL